MENLDSVSVGMMGSYMAYFNRIEYRIERLILLLIYYIYLKSRYQSVCVMSVMPC